LWRSENRGDSWTAISGDQTRNQERLTLPIGGRTWSWDSPWDINAMSTYNTITSIAESPVKEGVLYTGTDDGLINFTPDGGTTWEQIEVGDMPGVPATAFVNDIKADLFDVNTVYIALDNHKFGDLNPYLLKSTDNGKNWVSIKSNIPDRTLVWRIVQDHVNPDLLFAATEFGIYFSVDGGGKWIKFTSGVPTISFRDLAIQRRENDLVGASFGRGFYILDDYSALRTVTEEELQKDALLFPVRDAGWYSPRYLGVIKGASDYAAPNPPFGAVFTYYLKEKMKTLKDIRKEKERELKKAGKDAEFPGWDEVEKERLQEQPIIWLTIKDAAGNVIRKIQGNNQKGFNRTAWDFRNSALDGLSSEADLKLNYSGSRMPPGTYSVTLSKQEEDIITELAGPVSFEVVRWFEGALPGADLAESAEYGKEIERFNASYTAVTKTFDKAMERVKLMRGVLTRTQLAPGTLDSELHNLNRALVDIDQKLRGNRSKDEVGEKSLPTIRSRYSVASAGTRSSYGPTPMHKRSLEIAAEQLAEIKIEILKIVNEDIPKMEKALMDAGAPWLDGQPIPEF
jgi:hypothetical protein